MLKLKKETIQNLHAELTPDELKGVQGATPIYRDTLHTMRYACYPGATAAGC